MSVLKHRNFALVWFGQIVSVVGDGMRMMALIWLAKTQSGSNATVIAVAAAIAVPVVLGSPLGGWAADRFDRRHLLIAADIHRAVLSAVLAVMLFSDRLSTVWLCTLVALASCGTALFEPTFGAVVPSLVPEEDRMGANGLNVANSAGGSLLGPLVGGALLAAVGPGWVLAIDAGTFVWSAVMVALAHIPQPHKEAVARVAGGADPVTLKAVLADRVVRRLGGLACALNFLVAPLTVMLVALAVDKHHVGPRTYGVLDMTIPAGLLAGSLIASRLARFRSTALVSLVAIGLLLGIVGVVPLVLVMLALVATGLCLALANTVLITLFQSLVAPEVQGRAFGVLGALSQALRPTGLLLAGPLLAFAGIEWGFAVIGGSFLVATALWARPGRLEPTAPAGATPSVAEEPAGSTGRTPATVAATCS